MNRQIGDDDDNGDHDDHADEDCDDGNNHDLHFNQQTSKLRTQKRGRDFKCFKMITRFIQMSLIINIYLREGGLEYLVYYC